VAPASWQHHNFPGKHHQHQLILIYIVCAAQFASDIAAGMTHLHANRIVHGDLKVSE
jgi:serine/threonine protein kinase